MPPLLCLLRSVLSETIHLLPLVWGRVVVAAGEPSQPRHPFPRQRFPVLLRDSKELPGHSSGSALGSPPGRTRVRVRPWRHPDQTPKPPQLVHFDVKDCCQQNQLSTKFIYLTVYLPFFKSRSKTP